MTKMSDAQVPSLTLEEVLSDGSTLTNPAADHRRLFLGEDGLLHLRDSAGAITDIGAGAVATDAIWDAAGDLAVGSGANTAVKLAIGAAGGALSRVNGAVAWNSGTAMPTAATGDRFWRTDLGMEFYYDGTRWLSASPSQVAFPLVEILPLSATGTPHRMAMPQTLGGSDIYLAGITISFYVDGGTALSASHKWDGAYSKSSSAGLVSLGTSVIDSGSSSQWRAGASIAINALATSATYMELEGAWTKTGTPGNLYVVATLSYRIVAT